MRNWMRVVGVVFSVGMLGGCMVPAADGDESEPSAEAQALCSKRTCDSWLESCWAKGGREETQPGGIRMCCRSNSSGKECISDPDSWPTRTVSPPKTVAPPSYKAP